MCPSAPKAFRKTAVMADWFTPGRFGALLGLLIVAMFPSVIFGRDTFFFLDFGTYSYPVAFHHRESFWRGELPLWNPLNNCGIPFLAQWTTLVLYPLSLLYLLCPLSWSLGFFCLAHLWLAGMGMYRLARDWTGSQVAAVVAGTAFAFNGFTLNCLFWPSYMAALAWMPLTVLAVNRGLRSGGGWLLPAAAAGAMQMLAGVPEIILMTWVILVALGTEAALAGSVAAGRLALRFSLVVVLVTGLAAVQLLPFLDLAVHSHRQANFADAGWAMPPTGWANLLVPLFHTARSFHGVYMQQGQTLVSSFFPGIGILLLAVLALQRWRDRHVGLLVAVAVGGLVLALGDAGFVYAWLRKLCPPLGLIRFQLKFVIFAIFALPLLAAFGVTTLRGSPRAEPRVGRLLPATAAVLTVFTLAITWLGCTQFLVTKDDLLLVASNGFLRGLFLWVITGLFVLASRSAGKPRAAILTLAIPAVLWLDVRTHTPVIQPLLARGAYEPGVVRSKLQWDPMPAHGLSRVMVSPEALRRLRHSALPDAAQDFLGRRLALFGNGNLLDGLPKLNGFYALYPREADDVQALLYDSGRTNLTGLMDFLGASHFNPPGKAYTWTNRASWMPLLSAGQQAVFLDTPAVLPAMAEPTFDPRRTVFLPAEARAALRATNAAAARIVSAQVASHHLEAEVEADRPALVVVAQTYYHSWRAEVDGNAAKIWRANHAFQALEIPRGRHRLRLVYADQAFRVGAGISGLSLAGLLLAWMVIRKDPTPAPGHGHP